MKKNIVKEIGVVCQTKIEEDDIKIARRIGRYNPENPKRPLLVVFKELNTKKGLFKNVSNLKDSSEFGQISINNDLTKEERKNEEKLWELAKDLQNQHPSGDYTYKVRGPPCSRKVTKVAVKKKK